MHGKHLTKFILGILLFIAIVLITYVLIKKPSNNNTVLKSIDNVQSVKENTNISNKPSLEIDASFEEIENNSKSIEYPVGLDISSVGGITDKGNIILKVLNNNVTNSISYFNIDEEPTKENLKLIKEIDEPGEFNNFIIHSSYDDYILFEEYYQLLKKSIYYVYDFKNNKLDKVYEATNVWPIHFTHSYWYDKTIYMNFQSSDPYTYLTFMYNTDTKKFSLLNLNHSTSPVVIGDNLYYIKINNKTRTTEVIKHNINTNNEESIYSIKDSPTYIEHIYYDGKNPYIIINDQGLVEIYMADDLFNPKDLLYKSTGIEHRFRFSKNFIIFTGDPKNEDRRRSDYIINLHNKKLYDYNNGIVLTSDNYLLWIKYKKDPTEIPKGGVFKRDNSCMMVYKLNK